MSQQRDELHMPAAGTVPEEDYSLEAILAEYGKGGRQPAQNEPTAAPSAVPQPEVPPAQVPAQRSPSTAAEVIPPA